MVEGYAFPLFVTKNRLRGIRASDMFPRAEPLCRAVRRLQGIPESTAGRPNLPRRG